MIGPIIYQELLLGARRSRLHRVRWFYASLLILQVGYLFLVYQQEKTSLPMGKGFQNQGMASSRPDSVTHILAGRFAEVFVWQQLLLLVLVVPTMVGGAVTEEKRSGNLLYLLSSGVDSREIILGKLLGRMAQVLLIVLSGLPLFAFLGGFAGIDPLTMAILGIELTLALFALSSASLLASVWCRQTRDAILSLYFFGFLGWVLVIISHGLLDYFNPLFVIAPVWEQSLNPNWKLIVGRLLASVLCWGTLGGTLLAVAMLRLRPVYRRELESINKRKIQVSRERFPGDQDPILWREQHIEGLSPFRPLRQIPQWFGILIIMGMTTVSSLWILNQALPPSANLKSLSRVLLHHDLPKLAQLLPNASIGFFIQSIIVLLIASLVVGIRCSSSISAEREKQTWDAILLTPLTAKRLIHGKLWGVLQASYVYLLAYGSLAIVYSALGGLMAFCWTLLGLVVTVLAMVYIGSAGIWCSVVSKNSWRALLGTMALGYLGGMALYLVSTPIIAILAGLVLLFLSMGDWILNTRLTSVVTTNMSTYWNLFFIASCFGLALIFFLMSRLFISLSQRFVADKERTRHWQEEKNGYTKIDTRDLIGLNQANN